jgi:hypothetical protein
MSYELISVVMPSWSKTLAGVRGVEGREKVEELTVRPGTYLGGMAGQCLRGQQDATRGGLHRGTTGSTATGASTGVLTHTEVLSKKHSWHRGRSQRGIASGVPGGGRS